MTAATAGTRVHRILVKPDSSIRALADLRGRRLGTFPGSQMVVFLKLILGRFFDAEREVEIIQLKPQLQAQALEAGQVDAIFCLEPTCTVIEAGGLGRTISVNPLFEFIQKPFPTAGSVVSVRLAREKPATVTGIMAALQTAHDYLKRYPHEASLALPKYTPIEADLAPRISLYEYWDVKSIDRAAVQRLADLYASKGIIPRSISTAGLYANVGN